MTTLAQKAPAGFFRCRCHKMHSQHGWDMQSRCDCGRPLWREFAGREDQTYADPMLAICAALRAEPGDRHVTIDPAQADLVNTGYVLWSESHDQRFLLVRVHIRYEWQLIEEDS